MSDITLILSLSVKHSPRNVFFDEKLRYASHNIIDVSAFYCNSSP